MSTSERGVIRLTPQMIPDLRASFSDAVDQVEAALIKLSREGFLPAAWLGDEVSNDVAAHYLHRAMEAPESSFKFLQQYRAELARTHDTLQQMEDDYRRREGDNAALWGRRA